MILFVSFNITKVPTPKPAKAHKLNIKAAVTKGSLSQIAKYKPTSRLEMTIAGKIKPKSNILFSEYPSSGTGFIGGSTLLTLVNQCKPSFDLELLKRRTISYVKLAKPFNPMKSERMREG